MKTASLLAAILGLGILIGHSATTQQTNGTTTGINLFHVPVDKALEIYKQTSKTELIIASDVRHATHVITLRAVGVSPEVLQQMIKHALLTQAGIVITRLDDKRASVTYNDQLVP